MSKQTCLSEAEIWELVVRPHFEQVAASVPQTNVCGCRHCQDRVQALQAAVDEIRTNVELDRFLDPRKLYDSQTGDFESNSSEALDECEVFDGLPEVLIDRYQLLRQLSRGGQGSVFLAEDFVLQRHVAIKVSHCAVDEDSEVARRVQLESRMLARLNHARLPQVFDAGIVQGRCFLVMEYVEGRSLAEMVRSETLSVRQIHRLMSDIVEAVREIHRHGILHLDLKPENVLVTEFDRCKVVDLGIAWSPDQSEVPTTGLLGGTPEYMSPERFTATRSTPTCSDDIYGLGAILYTLLTGQTPHRAISAHESLDHGSWEQARRRLRAARVDGELRRICLKAMSYHARDRHRSIECFARGLKFSRLARYFPWIVGAGVASLLMGLSMDYYGIFGGVLAAETRTVSSSSAGEVTLSRIAISGEVGPNPQLLIWMPGREAKFWSSTPQSALTGEPAFEVKLPRQGLTINAAHSPMVVLLLGNSNQRSDQRQLREEFERVLSKRFGQRQRFVDQRSRDNIRCLSKAELIELNSLEQSDDVTGFLVHARAQNTESTSCEILFEHGRIVHVWNHSDHEPPSVRQRSTSLDTWGSVSWGLGPRPVFANSSSDASDPSRSPDVVR